MAVLLAATSSAGAVAALAVALVGPQALAPRRRTRELEHRSRRTGGSAAVARVVCPRWAEVAIRRADLPSDPDHWWHATLAVMVVLGLLGTLIGGLVLGVLAAASAAAALGTALVLAQGRSERRLVASIPEALDAVARATRAGSSVPQALAGLAVPGAGPAAAVLAGAARRVERGASLTVALDELVERHPVHEIRLAVTALIVSHDAGSTPAGAVEGVAATLRDRAALDREAAGHATQARASAAVMLLVPPGFAAFAATADPRVADFLLRSVPGWLCLFVGVGLDALGAFWMHRIMAAAR